MTTTTQTNQRTQLEAYLHNEIHRMAALQYYLMEKKDHWGELGEQRVAITYCRLLLKIPHHEEVTQEHANAFREELEKLQQPFVGVPIDELEKMEEDMKCDLLGRQVEWFKEEEINGMLEFLGSPFRIIVGFLGTFRSVIYGPAKVTFLDEYRVTEFLEETARTPAAVLSIAAVVGGKHVCLRHESCHTIFANKWQSYFEYQSIDASNEHLDRESATGEAFKAKALAAYGCKSAEDVAKIRPQFIEEMLEGLIWHEVGHGIVLNSLITADESAFGEALAVLGNNIVAVMKEFLADWAPARPAGLLPEKLEENFQKKFPGRVVDKKEDLRKYLDEAEFNQLKRAFLSEPQDAESIGKHIRGPLRHIVNIARTSAEGASKATRMLYVYLSDNWFLSSGSDNFNNHTDVLVSFLLPYIKTNAQFDFELWSQDLPLMFARVLEHYLKIVSTLEKMLKAAHFDYENGHLSFAEYAVPVRAKVHSRESGLKEDSMEFLVPFYAEMLENLNQTNPVLLSEIQEVLTNENQKFHKAHLSWLKGEPESEFSELALREYLLGELKEKGF
jgi:hypothetical protein